MPVSKDACLTALQELAVFCSRSRLDLSLEKPAQEDLEHLLEEAGYVFEREYKLGSDRRDIVDFFVKVHGANIAIELKTRAQRMAIYRQLERYAHHDQVDGLLLLTGTAMTLPAMIVDKPARVASMGRGWL